MLLRGSRVGCVATTFIQILKTVVRIGKNKKRQECSLYFNLTCSVVYKFTASLPQIRYKGRITFKSANSLYYSVKSPVPVKEELLFKSGIKVAAPPPPPIININNSYLSTPTSYTAISCGLAITETLPISIFLAVSTVNKVSYKLYRRGCP